MEKDHTSCFSNKQMFRSFSPAGCLVIILHLYSASLTFYQAQDNRTVDPKKALILIQSCIGCSMPSVNLFIYYRSYVGSVFALLWSQKFPFLSCVHRPALFPRKVRSEVFVLNYGNLRSNHLNQMVSEHLALTQSLYYLSQQFKYPDSHSE